MKTSRMSYLGHDFLLLNLSPWNAKRMYTCGEYDFAAKSNARRRRYKAASSPDSDVSGASVVDDDADQSSRAAGKGGLRYEGRRRSGWRVSTAVTGASRGQPGPARPR